MTNIWTDSGNLPPGFKDPSLNKTGGGTKKETSFNEGTRTMEYNKLWDKMSDKDKEYILKYDNKD